MSTSKEFKHSETNQRRRQQSKKKLPLIAGIITGVGILGTVVGLFFFQSHFLPHAEINGIKVGWLSAEAAKEKIEKINKRDQIVIKVGDQKEQIKLPQKYEISKKYLQENIGKKSVNIPVNKEYQAEIKTKLEALALPEGTPSQDAKITREGTAFHIVSEQYGTQINKEQLVKQIISDVVSDKQKELYDVKDFYIQPAIKKEDKTLTEKLAQLTKKMNKQVTVDINGEKVPFSKEELLATVNDNGEIDPAKLTTWVQQMNQQHASLDQSVIFKDVHGQTRKYKNNGSYGWAIDQEKMVAALQTALSSENEVENLTAPVVGDVSEKQEITGTYVEIDLNDQKMYFFKDGQKIVDTNVITGRYNKGTATVPGFHTILYKQTDTKLEGEMLDGSKYSVPVKYWMPLLSYGGVVTQIGIHDADYKSEHFGNKEAYKTNFGSNGCINTPGVAVAKIFESAYEGMPVIIYGSIYDSAPGEFDKPVDYGEPV